MEQVARETQYDFGEFITAQMSKDIVTNFSEGFARTCSVAGEGYPGDKHQLLCMATNTVDRYPEYFPATGLDGTKGSAIVQQAKALGEKLHYTMELSMDSDGAVSSTTGTRGECEITFGYQLASGPYAIPNAPQWTETTPSLSYKLECVHAVFRNRKGSMTTPCSNYTELLPTGYKCG